MLLLLFLLCRFFARVRPDLIGRLFHMVHHSDRPMYSCICVCLCVRMSPHFLLSSDFGSTIYLAAFLCTVFSALLAMMRVYKTNVNFVSLSLLLLVMFILSLTVVVTRLVMFRQFFPHISISLPHSSIFLSSVPPYSFFVSFVCLSPVTSSSSYVTVRPLLLPIRWK